MSEKGKAEPSTSGQEHRRLDSNNIGSWDIKAFAFAQPKRSHKSFLRLYSREW